MTAKLDGFLYEDLARGVSQVINEHVNIVTWVKEKSCWMIMHLGLYKNVLGKLYMSVCIDVVYT